ncbi:flagellar hook-associated protein 3 [Alginatibacterium sediminis]|uniref:Flagellar hook-associated protein 3 n=1 Tax=Alginatibacterium sediminis TaxID=2164068 RepID=A0A420EFZ7_9ALTE|nr:flagellar hook-associated protein FlgL [Alginatibacterium sediminis]RKF19632.1 flagellar hook-associated protein 3 [Alginatibacterium sediminis]
MRVSNNMLYQTSLRGVLKSQQELEVYNKQLVSGKKLLTAADGPADMSKAMFLSTEISLNEQYRKNVSLLESGLNFEESVLQGVMTSMQRARVLGIQSGDGINGMPERESLADELEQIREELLDSMNSKDANGEYIFSGHQSSIQSFAFDGQKYSFQGDLGTSQLKASSSIYIQSNDSGGEVFENVNKRYGTSGDVNLTSRVNDQTGFDTFHQNNYDPITAANNTYNVAITTGPPDTYTVTNSSPGFIPITGPYTAGEPIAFNGLSIDMNGSATGSFDLEVPSKSNVLNVINDYISVLRDPAAIGDPFEEAQADFIVGIDNSMSKVNLTMGSLGARGNSLDRVVDASLAMDEVNQGSRAAIAEVDFAEAVTNLQKAELALNTSYSSYSRISQLSLFNYL